MTTNIENRRAMALGGALLGLGLVWALNLWWLLLPASLVAAGVIGYRERRKIGRHDEAIQAGLWGTGLAMIVLLGAWLPGLLILGGTSLLLRGRETAMFDRLLAWVGLLLRRAPAAGRATPAQDVPVTTVEVETMRATTNDTTRF